MNDRPEVSVVIPTRDRWHLLSTRALPSALAQDDVEHEVVVVDDGSIQPADVELPARGDDPRLRIVRRERSEGMAAARNAGIVTARGEWVAFLDDDDVWSPRKLREQLDAARAARADFAYAGVVAVDERGAVLDTLYLPRPDELQAKLSRACVIPAGCSNVVARVDLLRSVGGFDESFVHVADWDLWIRLAHLGAAAVCDAVLVAYLLHTRNIHVIDDPSAELDALIEKHASETPPRTIAPDRLGYSRWVAGQRSRAGLNRAAAGSYLRSGVRFRSPGNILRAADALLGKRPSRAVGRLRAREQASTAASPEWLRRYVA